jgi:hypothetical protein
VLPPKPARRHHFQILMARKKMRNNRPASRMLPKQQFSWVGVIFRILPNRRLLNAVLTFIQPTIFGTYDATLPAEAFSPFSSQTCSSPHSQAGLSTHTVRKPPAWLDLPSIVSVLRCFPCLLNDRARSRAGTRTSCCAAAC